MQKEGNQKHTGGRKIQKEKSMEMQSKKGNTLKSHRMNTLAYSIKPKARVKYETTHSTGKKVLAKRRFNKNSFD